MHHIVYSPRYDIRACGLERLHPFDSRKYGRAYARLRRAMGAALTGWTTAPRAPLGTAELLEVHSADYLSQLRRSAYLARALEVPSLRRLPAPLIRHLVLKPMRWACAGSILAGHEAIAGGFAVNLSGGYHHAKPEAGEGFCIYSDIALMVSALRRRDEPIRAGRIAYVDLDAHQGNGVCHCFLDDRSVFVFDMFNSLIYPVGDTIARRRIDCACPLEPGCDDGRYLDVLRSELPRFLDAVSDLRLLIYNAGSDVLRGDLLGGLSLSPEAIIDRDRFVVRSARERGIPVVMLLSGGYTPESHVVIADSVESLLSGFAGTDVNEDVPDDAVDYDEVMRRGGANFGNEEFTWFKCPRCGRVYLFDCEVEVVYLDGRDLSQRVLVIVGSFACMSCGHDVPDDEPWVGPRAADRFKVTRPEVERSDWAWAVRRTGTGDHAEPA